MRTIIITLCALLLMAIPVKAEEMVLYDNFNSFLIEPTKWYGRARGNLLIRDAIREIKGDSLRMALVAYSDTGSDAGQLWATNELRFDQEVALKITAVKARMRVNHFHVMDCNTNPAGPGNWSFVRSRMGGVFFHGGNMADSTDPFDFTGDIFADIRIWKTIDNSGTSNRLLEVVYWLGQCLDAPCDTINYVVFKSAHTIRRKHWITLGIKWDKDNRQFVFQYGSEKDFVDYPETWDPEFPAPSGLLKFLRVQASVLNCMSQPRPMYLMDASFDNVYVNELAVTNAGDPD